MSNWSEGEIVLVSAIEHSSYCPRRCALIHIEKAFDENVLRNPAITRHVSIPITGRPQTAEQAPSGDHALGGDRNQRISGVRTR